MRFLRLFPIVVLGLALTAPGSVAAAPVCATAPTGRVSWFPFGGSSVDLVRAKLSTDDGGVGASLGKVGDGYLFDGLTGRVLVGDPAELALTGSLSIEAWVRVDVANSNGMILFRGEPSPGVNPYYLGLQNGKLVFHVEDGSTADFVSPNPLAVSTLTHVAATLDDSTGDVHLYVDGIDVLSGNTSVRPLATVASGGGVVVGNTIDGGSTNAFEGIIDELSTYSTTLTPTQVQAIYAADSAGTCGTGGRVQFTTSSTVVDEDAGTVQLLVFRTAGQAGAASVSFQTADGITTNPATDPSDYLGASGTLNWGPNDVSLKVINVSIVNDSDYETQDEKFLVDLSGPSGATLGSKKRITVYINGPNDNPGTIQYQYPSFNGYEDLCSATVTVTRTGGSAGIASVDYTTTTGGTATLTADYSATSGTLNWGDGDMTPKTFDVPLACPLPGVPENTETIKLSLSNVLGAFAGAHQTSQILLYDSPGRIAFNVSSVAINEGGTAVVTVDRLFGRGTSVSVDYTIVAGSATAGSDYTATPPSGQLVWGYGEGSSKTITIPTILDATPESPETFQVQLSNETSWPNDNTAILGSTAATVTINDSIKGRVSFTGALFSVSEGAGTVLVTVERTQPGGPTVNTPATITLSLEDIAAQLNSDYDPISDPATGVLFWTAGELGTKTITIPILQDALNEGPEDFRVRITSTSDLPASPVTTRVQINDDDPPGAVSFTVAAQNVNEATGTVTALVRRTGGSAGAFDVLFSVNPGTADSSDYGTPSPATTITFADGDTADKSITIPIITDGLTEPLETFTVRLDTITMTTGVVSATFGSPRTQTIRITANSN